MSYAGITKGFTALGAAMMLAATRNGSAAAVRAANQRLPTKKTVRFLNREIRATRASRPRTISE